MTTRKKLHICFYDLTVNLVKNVIFYGPSNLVGNLVPFRTSCFMTLLLGLLLAGRASVLHSAEEDAKFGVCGIVGAWLF